VMIQESYVKEICRIKKQIEDTKAEEAKVDDSFSNPPNTASS